MPEGWAFARINALFYIQTGASFKKEQATNDISQIRVLRGGNILQGEYRFFDNDIFIDNHLISSNILLRVNDLITPAVTSIENIGKLALIDKNYDRVTAGGFVFIIRPYYSSSAFAKYMLYALQSSYFNKQLKSITKKSGQAFYNLGKERLTQLIVPIPPIQEEERIVAEIERFIPFIKEYDLLEQQATKLDDEIYDNLKKSILQYAIQGKLVPQDENDEPASVLLERIRAEKKAQLGKKYVESYIYKGDDNCYYEHINGKNIDITEEIPFDLPASWSWVRLKSILNVVSARRVHQSDWKSEGIPFYRAREIAKLALFNEVQNELFISNELFEAYKATGIPLPGDLMVTAVGTIGKTYIVKETDKFYYKDASVLCFENRFNFQSFWLKYLIDSPYMIEQIKAASAGTTVETITIEKAKEYLLPVPPLAEQKRIVEKIDDIFAKL